MSNNPKNIAVIMDGNRRWSNSRGLPFIAGYKKGAKVLKNIVNRCIELNIQELLCLLFQPKTLIENQTKLKHFYIIRKVFKI